ncbi:MAG TPA: hypothetical protein VEG38_18915 [Acidimicrobiia bacterium]|nr:hypothetical protein [Acidimicrobiia bacterium]
MLRTEPTYMGRAKNLMAGGFALLAFVTALAVGTAGAPALGGVSWIMVTAGAAGIVYVGGALIVTAFVALRTPAPRALRPAAVLTPRAVRARSTR